MMKRIREDQAQSGSAGKRPGSQRPGSQNQLQKLTTSDALSYLKEVKQRFSDQKDVYDKFLDIMKDFKAQKIDTQGVIRQVRQLFKGHKELILGFNQFLPKGSEIHRRDLVSDDDQEQEEGPVPGRGEFNNKQPVEFDQAINYVNKIKKRFAADDRVYKSFLEILNMYRKGHKDIRTVYEEVERLFKHEPDLLEEFTYFLPDAQAVKDQQQRRGGGAGTNFRGGGNSRPQGGRGAHLQSTSPVLKHKRKTAQRAEEGFKAGYGFNDDVELRKPIMARELQYFERVKARLRANRDAYPDLIRSIHLYNHDILSKYELLGIVNDILGKCPDLMAGFHEFVHKCEIMEGDSRAGGLGIPAAQRDAMKRTASMLPREKMLSKPLSEIVAHETERVTQSYVKIPSTYPHLECTGRTELGRSVLNDVFVNVITGSEDYSFKLMRKNQYEESLFRCEDDRYEFELVIETNASGIKAVRSLLERINTMPIEERASFRIEEGMLSPVHYKAIDALYAEFGQVMVDLVRKNPSVALPIVLGRMEKKDAEWRAVKEEMMKIWFKIYEQNYHKSLDHRSFYFKQAEKKQLLPKTMVQEAREAADRRRDEAPSPPRVLPLSQRYEAEAEPEADLSFDYSERNVFEDCWTVLRTAIEESVGPGTREQVLHLYLTFVEPFFNLPIRNDEISKIKKMKGSRHRHSKQRRAAGGLDAKSDSSEPEADGDATDGGGGRSGASKASSPEPGDGDAQDAISGPDTGVDDGRDMERGSAVEDGDESNDEQPGRNFLSCKPLAPFSAVKVESLSDESQAVRSKERILLANENLYIFFRYHRHLYDRLWIARKCATQQANMRGLQHMRPVATPPPPGLDGSDPVLDAAQQAEAEAQVIKEEGERLHNTFMAMTQKLLVGELEVSLFEDQVRALLGTNSYELFTLDKLVGKLIGHMRLMVQDDQTMRLADLFHYELARSGGMSPLSYHINSHAVLDDLFYRIRYDDNTRHWKTTLMEPEKPETFVAVEGLVNQYIRQFISTPAALPEADKALHLSRNFVSLKVQPDTTDEAVSAALQNVYINNGLECKVSCNSSKISYVLDTEDVMFRLKRHASSPFAAYKENRRGCFLTWFEETQKRMREVAEVAEGLAHGLVAVAAATIAQQ
ncbi:hypothetical protein CEUSTIGMA_g4950.t1 [Chlamydomonas eustigma]|uniref:Histone deacetylase interacting domain-containing protein n=1 Tax=Chlamydomonas eustigma TaxID=1157962 RepID=A0A250X371_9CHLO|nr:hypothetical protein CEUSTIGMA_g4950.t1 [Chlamydomonas eustigma]|eukprot:GAX77506.1 hypothetical protein CEUSTIGMA_g4950.t1 [Chlamydomonas eustigma]